MKKNVLMIYFANSKTFNQFWMTTDLDLTLTKKFNDIFGESKLKSLFEAKLFNFVNFAELNYSGSLAILYFGLFMTFKLSVIFQLLKLKMCKKFIFNIFYLIQWRVQGFARRYANILTSHYYF